MVPETQEVVAQSPFQALTALDRCDRCSAAAKSRAAKFSEDASAEPFVLLFCGHHLRKAEEKLVEQGFEIFGEG